MAHHAYSLVHHEGTFVSSFGGSESSSSYSMREIVLERASVLVVDFSNTESIEGLAAGEVEMGIKIEEDPIELEVDSKIETEIEEDQQA